jgi:transposase-like protein
VCAGLKKDKKGLLLPYVRNIDKSSFPHCQGANVVKNGHKKDGAQNFLCKACSKQIQSVYKYQGVNPTTKHLIVSMLLRNSGIRDIQTILKVSRGCVLHTLISEAQKCVIGGTTKVFR